MLTGLFTALLLASIAGMATTDITKKVDSVKNGTNPYDSDKNQAIARILNEHPELSKDQAEAYYEKYKGTGEDLSAVDYLDPKNWFNGWGDSNWNTDWDSINEDVAKLQEAYDVLGEMPEDLSSKDLEKIRNEAAAEIDAENNRIADLYKSSFDDTTNFLQKSLAENSAMFNDYRTQLLTDSAMRQQAIAGSARFELDRAQRNAITRGASAAQRLVANINTQLGLQAQSAQQALTTSNALAQSLLAHRQAQQGLRDSYMNAQNQYNANLAGLIRGSAAQKQAYGDSKVNSVLSDRSADYDIWERKKQDYFKNDSIGYTQYGSGKKSSI